MRLRSLAIVAALALCLGTAVRAQEVKKAAPAKAQQAKKAPAKVQLPAAITEAFEKAYPQAKITGTSKESEAGQTVYEVESVDRGLSRDLIYRPDGSVVEIEEQINAADVPAAVAEALKRLYPAAKIAKAEKLTRGETVQFEFALSGAARKEAAFTPDGKLVSPGTPQPKKPVTKEPAASKLR